MNTERFLLLFVLMLLIISITGCATAPPPQQSAQMLPSVEELTISEGVMSTVASAQNCPHGLVKAKQYLTGLSVPKWKADCEGQTLIVSFSQSDNDFTVVYTFDGIAR